MRSIVTWLASVAFAVFFGSASAVPPGPPIEYAGGPMGKVVFDGKIHAGAGLKCPACHTKIFQMKKEVKMTMADLNAGKYCGTCHNGDKAFKTSDDANCAKCHKK
ncbi:MAG: cytochrome c3 family protein [Betaproteobacteria bacterium]|nr:cytochrome c3 family protein [Betaproteobacteria bacterium]